MQLNNIMKYCEWKYMLSRIESQISLKNGNEINIISDSL